MVPDDKQEPTPTSVRLDPPAPVRDVGERVRAAGAEVWVVGGAVRDALMGRASADWDLATSLHPDQLVDLFPEAEDRDRSLGVARVATDAGAISVTTFRTESDYRDRRHPAQVTFVESLEEDARRRDFTVNAIYADLSSGAIRDPVHGLRDVRDRVLRVIGDPVARLGEDPLRLFRGLRFATGHGLEIETVTRRAISECAPLAKHVAAERVFEELTRTFTGPGRGRGLRLAVELGLAAEVLPELVPMDGVPQPPEYHPEGDVLTHVCLVLDHVRAGDAVQAWSAVLHDVGKPATFERAPDRIRFSGHDTLSAKMAEEILRRFRAPRSLIADVVDVSNDHIRFASILEMKPGRRERWLRQPNFEHHLEFHRADCEGSHGDLSIYRAAKELFHGLPPLPPPPLCTGADVIARGIPEGPLVGEVLRELRERLDGEVDPTRGLALKLLDGIVAGKGQGS